MPPQNATSTVVTDMADLESRLTLTVGALIGGANLTKALGYPSQGAFRQAVLRNRVPVHVFEIEGRRGRFALACDVAAWLVEKRAGSIQGAAGRQRALEEKQKLIEQFAVSQDVETIKPGVIRPRA